MPLVLTLDYRQGVKLNQSRGSWPVVVFRVLPYFACPSHSKAFTTGSQNHKTKVAHDSTLLNTLNKAAIAQVRALGEERAHV